MVRDPAVILLRQSGLEGLVDVDSQWLKHRRHSRWNNDKFTFQSVNFVLNFISKVPPKGPNIASMVG